MVTFHEKQRTQTKNEKWPLRTRLIAAIGAAAAMATLGACSKTGAVNVDNAGNVVTTVTLNEDGTVSDGTKVGQTEILTSDINHDGKVNKDDVKELKDPLDTEKFTPAELVNIYGADFDSWRQDTYNLLVKNARLDAKQLEILSVPSLDTPKEQWSDQMILNAITLDVADAGMQTTPVEGAQMLPAVYSNTIANFNRIRNKMIDEDNRLVTLNVWKAGLPNPKPQNGTFMSISGLSENARIVYGEPIVNENESGKYDPEINYVVDLQIGSDGKTKLWRVVAALDNGAAVQLAIANLNK